MASKTKNQGMLLHGIASAEVWDSTAEKTIIEGMDITDIHEGKCLLNFEHLQPKDGGMGQEFVGKVIFGKKLFKLEDCENATQKRIWNKYKVPILYVVCRLYDGAGHPGAIALASMVRDAVANGDPAVLGLSVEGTTVERDGGLLKKTIIRAIAVTVKPASKVCYPELLFDPNAPVGFDKIPDEKETEDVLQDVLENLNKAEPKEADFLKDIHKLVKAAVVQKMMQKTDPLHTFNKLSMQYTANGMAPSDFKWTDPDLAFLQKVKSAPITINFSPTQLHKIARNGQHRNLFQHDAGTAEFDERKDFEHRILGLPVTEWAKNRPIYGALHVDHMDPSPEASGVGAAPLYGTAYWILKHNVKDRSSFTHADSYLVTAQDVLLNKDVDKLAAKHLLSRATDPDPVIEAQIHGGVDLSTDVQGLVVHSEDPEILKTAQRVGINYNLPVTAYDSEFNRTILNTPIEGLIKTTTAGGGNVAPSQLTGGAALAREVWPKKKKIKELMYKAFCESGQPDDKESFAKFVKASIPEVSDGYLDYYDEAKSNVDIATKSFKKSSPEQVLRKIEFLSIETKELIKALQETPSVAASKPKEKVSTIAKDGQDYVPGQAMVQGKLFYITDEKADVYIAHPYDNAEAVTRLPKADAGKTYKLLKPLHLADPKMTLSAGEHGVAHLNQSPLQHSMIDGLKLDRNPTNGPLAASHWADTPQGKVFVKQGSSLRPNAATEEVAISNVAQNLGMGMYFPTCAAYTCPETGAMCSVHAAMSDLQHPDTAENAYIRLLQKLGENGELDKLAALDYILGSSVRSPSSVALSPDRLFLIDNQFGDGGLPSYTKDQDKAEHYEWLCNPMHPVAQSWLQSLNRDTFLTHLRFNGADSESQKSIMGRFDSTRTNLTEPRRKVYG